MLELIPVYRQSDHRWLIKSSPAVGCHYFLPGLWSPSQPNNVTVLRPVPSYTAWWQRQIGMNNLPKVVMQLCPSGNWINNVLIASATTLCHPLSEKYFKKQLKVSYLKFKPVPAGKQSTHQREVRTNSTQQAVEPLRLWTHKLYLLNTFHSRACLNQLLIVIRSLLIVCNHVRSKTRLVTIITKLGITYTALQHNGVLSILSLPPQSTYMYRPINTARGAERWGDGESVAAAATTNW